MCFFFCFFSIRPGTKDELGILLCCHQRCEQTLHRHRSHLALCPFHFPHPGSGGCSRERVGRREVWLHLQHPAAGLQQRLLRPLLPHLSHPPLGAPAHPGLHSGPAGSHARRPPPPRRQEALQTVGADQPQRPGADKDPEDENHRCSLVDVRHQPAVPYHLRGHLHVRVLHDLPRVQDDPAGEVWLVPLSQHGGLLRVEAHREDCLHRVHAGCVRGVYSAQHCRGGLPGGKGLQ